MFLSQQSVLDGDTRFKSQTHIYLGNHVHALPFDQKKKHKRVALFSHITSKEPVAHHPI